MNDLEKLKYLDFEIFELINLEQKKQNSAINLIASENYVSEAVMQATGSCLTNKYAEGYPSKRYYSGCEFIDQIENLAIDRCKELFRAEHANVQPHSGSQANMAVYNAILNPGDLIMGMSLDCGGHLTHGHSASFSGKNYKTIQYSVNPETQELDYIEIEKMAKLYMPKLIIAGASAYSRIIDFERFDYIAKKIGAYFVVDMAHIAGLVAAEIHPSPVKYADFVTSTTHKTLRGPRGGFILCKSKYKDLIDKSIMPGIQGGPFMHIIAAKAVAFKEALNYEFKLYQQQIVNNSKAMVKRFKELNYDIVSKGTDNHLFIIDLRSKNITGKNAQEILEKFNIFVSKSMIPYDTQKPWITSGIRIGTAAMTTRNLVEKDFESIADAIDYIINLAIDNKDIINTNLADYKLRVKNIVNL